jgi:hypothetical protein
LALDKEFFHRGINLARRDTRTHHASGELMGLPDQQASLPHLGDLAL